MESSKDKAIKSIAIAERKISENDYVGAKKFVNKAQNLYPKLDGLKKMSMMIDVYISASKKINRKGEADWYGVLHVDPSANDEAIKKQYKKLALLLHPDKNKFIGATEAFKLISEAWCLLSDNAKRVSYDLKRKLKRHEQDFSWNKPYESYAPGPDFSWNHHEKAKVRRKFWTKCDRCNVCCQFGSDSAYLNETISCPNCRQGFVVTEKELKFNKSRDDTSASDSAKAAEERMRSWFEPSPDPNHEPDSSSEKEKTKNCDGEAFG